MSMLQPRHQLRQFPNSVKSSWNSPLLGRGKVSSAPWQHCTHQTIRTVLACSNALIQSARFSTDRQGWDVPVNGWMESTILLVCWDLGACGALEDWKPTRRERAKRCDRLALDPSVCRCSSRQGYGEEKTQPVWPRQDEDDHPSFGTCRIKNGWRCVSKDGCGWGDSLSEGRPELGWSTWLWFSYLKWSSRWLVGVSPGVVWREMPGWVVSPLGTPEANLKLWDRTGIDWRLMRGIRDEILTQDYSLWPLSSRRRRYYGEWNMVLDGPAFPALTSKQPDRR